MSLLLLVGMLASASLPALAIEVTRVSVSSKGTEGNFGSFDPTLSWDGRFVAFQSSATNLVAEDKNGAPDIFLHDRETGITTRVSVASDGTEGNGGSFDPSMSGDGRFITFRSWATNLVPDDTNNTSDIFVHDRARGVTTRISVSSDGTEGNGASAAPVISGNGQFVAFHSSATNLVSEDTNRTPDIFVHDLDTGLTERISLSFTGRQGNSGSVDPMISWNGRFVAFTSGATNLVPGDRNKAIDIFIRDRAEQTTTLVSRASDGTLENSGSALSALSWDGQLVAFQSSATNLTPEDIHTAPDIFIHDRTTGTTDGVSTAYDGTQGNFDLFPILSADGRLVSFRSLATDRQTEEIFILNRETKALVRLAGISGGGGAVEVTLSGDGRFIAFQSLASQLVSGDTNTTTDIFVAPTPWVE